MIQPASHSSALAGVPQRQAAAARLHPSQQEQRQHWIIIIIRSPLLGVHGPQCGVVQAAPHRMLEVVKDDGAHNLLAADLAHLRRGRRGGSGHAGTRDTLAALPASCAQLADAASSGAKPSRLQFAGLAAWRVRRRTSSSLKKPKLTAATWAVVGFLLCSDDCMAPPPAAGQSRSTGGGLQAGRQRRRKRRHSAAAGGWRRRHVGRAVGCCLALHADHWRPVHHAAAMEAGAAAGAPMHAPAHLLTAYGPRRSEQRPLLPVHAE